jgi:hypothetical protein
MTPTMEPFVKVGLARAVSLPEIGFERLGQFRSQVLGPTVLARIVERQHLQMLRSPRCTCGRELSLLQIMRKSEIE